MKWIHVPNKHNEVKWNQKLLIVNPLYNIPFSPPSPLTLYLLPMCLWCIHPVCFGWMGWSCCFQGGGGDTYQIITIYLNDTTSNWNLHSVDHHSPLHTCMWCTHPECGMIGAYWRMQWMPVKNQHNEIEWNQTLFIVTSSHNNLTPSLLHVYMWCDNPESDG